MSQRQYINQMKPSQRIEGAFTIANAQLGRTKNDKPYLRCLLSDKSAQVPARMWSMDEAHFERLPTDGFVYIEGETQDYQGQLQIVVHQIDPIDPSPEQLADLLPVSARNPDEMLARVEELIASLEHDGVRALGELFLEDEHFMREFTVAPAAKQLHHAHLHGLLEHTVSLMEAAHRLCPLYPGINRDLVVMGCFLQDIGKTRELRYDVGFAYTDLGELVGHIVEGTHMLRDKIDLLRRERGVRLPSGAALVLEHIILSHHSLPEHGAAKVPMSPEAILVALIDQLDAKTVIALDASGRTGKGPPSNANGHFTERNWALGAKIYRPDPLAKPDPISG